MKILLTGATGFVGQALTCSLLERGDEIVALVRDPVAAAKALGPKVGLLDSSSDDEALLAATAGVDAVVNLAGENVFGRRWNEARKQQLIASRVGLTGSLARAVASLPEDQRPSTFVSASAVGYYGDRGAETLTEESAPGEDFLAELCTEWEAATAPATEAGVRTVILRIGVVLGQGGALARLMPLFRFGLGGRVGSGEQAFPWIHREDLVRIILAALDEESYQGVYNATGPESVTNAGLTRSLASALHRPAIFPVPGFALKAAVGEAAEVLLGGQDAVPARLNEAGFDFSYPDVDSALAEIVAAR